MNTQIAKGYSMATIRIKNLKLETIIGIKDSERIKKQDVIINASIDVDTSRAIETDNIEDTLNYRTITKKIIKAVTESQFFLLEKLVDHVLKLIMEDERVLSASIEIDKPYALSFCDSVSVQVSSKREIRNKAVVGVGSNIDPLNNIKKAKEIIASELKLIAESNLTKSSPIGISNQNDFVNGAFLISTELNREGLNKLLKDVEIKLKRAKTTDKYGPRTIDLDIIVWNGEIVDKDFYKRDFVKKTVLEVMPSLEY